MSSKNHSKLNMSIVLAVSLVFLAAIAPGTIKADVIYVDADAVGKNNGSSWANAYTSLEETLTCHENGLVGHEVWVAAGTYTAKGTCCGIACEIIPRVASFRLINGVAIYGGFAGTEDPASFDLADRDFETNETILSGDIGKEGVISDNSYHVVNGSGTDATAILDGFTITGGYADGSEVGGWNVGAGMYNSTGSPTIVNCKFSENQAIAAGGGMYNNNASPTVVNCAFSANSSVNSTGGGMFNVNNSSPILTGCTFSNNSSGANGGGICNANNSNPTVTDCSFIDNSGGWGGGMSNSVSHPTLSNCTFIGNSAKANGGAIISNASGMTAENCIFMRNSAAQNGGGLYVIGGSPVLVNNIVSENSAGIDGGGLYIDYSCHLLMNNTIVSNTGGGVYEAFPEGVECMGGYRSITNCILWGNTGYDLTVAGKELVPTYSDIEIGFVEGLGNISADPMFVNPSAGDYRLKAGSPCIDAGYFDKLFIGILPEIDLDGNPRVCDGDGDGEAAIDVGAFEAIAGSTPSGTDVVVQPEDPATGETPVTLTFDDVTEGGVTTVNSTTPSAEQGAPEGFKFGNPPVMYEIATTADYTGNITVCFDYSGASYGNEAKLRLFHRTEGGWVDITTSIDTESKIICGVVTSLSFFTVFESELLSPVELLQQLAAKVFGLNLQQGISNSLDAKLDAALKALEDINANNDVAAVNTLEAFINAAQAQSGDKIPEAAAADLIATALEIITALSSE